MYYASLGASGTVTITDSTVPRRLVAPIYLQAGESNFHDQNLNAAKREAFVVEHQGSSNQSYSTYRVPRECAELSLQLDWETVKLPFEQAQVLLCGNLKENLGGFKFRISMVAFRVPIELTRGLVLASGKKVKRAGGVWYHRLGCVVVRSV
ncbi:hypothetical protein CC2G_013417 [Coprinopsis cinerea AmutBmut pab1-1]|nr:hypothetical protein CC2G_013417 [Coprinopsis cinerea AmutBmut pab1-1]